MSPFNDAEMPVDYAWTFPCFGLCHVGDWKPVVLETDSGDFFLPLFTDLDLSERFIQSNGMLDRVEGVPFDSQNDLRFNLDSTLGLCRLIIVDAGYLRNGWPITIFTVESFRRVVLDEGD